MIDGLPDLAAVKPGVKAALSEAEAHEYDQCVTGDEYSDGESHHQVL